MKRFWQMISVGLLLLPLVVGAETITWVLPTTYVDNTTISAADRARITVYLRGWKAGNPAAKTYFGEVRNGGISWNDNILTKMNQWGVSNNVSGWMLLKAGDNVIVTVSSALSYVDNGVTKEGDGPESPPYAWTLPGAVVVPPPPPPPPPPPVVVPSCNPPTGISIKP
jgi:hypothetical protein